MQTAIKSLASAVRMINLLTEVSSLFPLADRSTLVDNNTWNNTHIATVGKMMSSKEEVSYPILKKHDVDYLLVVVGSLIGFSGDGETTYWWSQLPSLMTNRSQTSTSSCG